ncbi:EcsC family protein [Anaerocolumna xylanovorans]|uniref:EcsC protein family protein n=1 Tax=Anaerocolumna xylanovorans DSM 12503 TaxID=1121345 RepID=A0A1M7Y4G0_9FIRM|nr:EcsC family protein [Anaerocolumna xylanovorans]SHO47196.1 EcsC protein family protein [Anaerocolumna xylanovorans DSM 12503]
MKKLLEEQLKEMEAKEEHFLQAKDNSYFKTKINPLLDKVRSKVPANLKETLDKAFFKAFELIYDKGTNIIEKTYNKDRLRVEHDINNLAVNRKLSKKHLKDLDKPSLDSSRFNATFSAIEGSVLGILGIGLPDIPVFLALIIKSMNEIALSYGFSYEREEEKVYICMLIQAALLQGKEQEVLNIRADELAGQIDTGTLPSLDVKKEMKAASSCFSEVLLTAKFIQGAPLIGVVGGIVNHSYIKRITAYSRIKYKKRYLLKKIREQQ